MITSLSKPKAFRTLGSVWSSHTTSEGLARARTLSTLPLTTSLSDTLGVAINSLLNLGPAVRRNVPLHVRKDRVVITRVGPFDVTEVNDFPWITEDNHWLMTEEGWMFVPEDFDSDPFAHARTWYRVPWEGYDRVLSILSDGVAFLPDIDFVQLHGWLWFKSGPVKTLGNKALACVEVAPVSTVSYLAGLDRMTRDESQYVIRLLRTSQDVGAYKTALRVVAGDKAVTKVSEVVGYREDPAGNMNVVTTSGTLSLDHAINPVAGGMLRAGGAVGDRSRVFAYDGVNRDWWRVLDWTDGLDAKFVTNFEGFTFPGTPVTAWVEGETGGVLHVRYHLDGDPVTVEKFWEHVEAQEVRTGKSLADVMPGLTSVGDTTPVVPVALLFEYALWRTAIVLKLDPERVINLNEVKTFATENLPVGKLLITQEGEISLASNWSLK